MPNRLRGAGRLSMRFRILCLGLPLILASAKQAQPPAEGNSAEGLPSAYATVQSDDAAVIGVDDVITIEALNVEEITKPWRVGGGGSEPSYFGRVHAAGMTAAQLEEELTTRLKQFVRNPQVTVFISEFHGHPATVSGAVEKPGVVQLQGPTSLFEVLVSAGGPKEAGPTVTLTRGHENGTIPIRARGPRSTAPIAWSSCRSSKCCKKTARSEPWGAGE